MVQIIQEQESDPLSALLGGIGSGIAQRTPDILDQIMIQRAGEDVSQLDPRLQNLVLQRKLLEQKLAPPPSIDPDRRRVQLQQLGLPEYFDELGPEEKKLVVSQAKEQQKLTAKEQEDAQGRLGALDVVSRMRDIRANGNLGFGVSARGIISPNTRRDRGEYEQLGKSLISFATNIPIRNRIEFETLAERLFDASITDSESEGLLDAMERLISKSGQVEGSPLLDRAQASVPIDQVRDGVAQPIADVAQPQQQGEAKPGILQQIGRVAGQFATGLAEMAALPYDLAMLPLASEQAQVVNFRQGLQDDLEQMLLQKQTGQWSEQDQAQLDNVIDLIANPRKSLDFVQTADLGVQGVFETALGVDLKPQGITEKAARWAGWIKNPANLTNLVKGGASKREIIKAVTPSGVDVGRSLAAGTALQAAEEGEFGPIGSIAAAVAADATAGGIGSLVRGIAKEGPKQFLAKGVGKLTGQEKSAIQSELIRDFNKSGLQADLGTISDNNVIKMLQTKFSQSGLTGDAFDAYKKRLTEEVLGEYKKVAESLGEVAFQSNFEAGTTLKNAVVNSRNQDLQQVRGIYQAADEVLGQEAKTFTDKLIKNTDNLIRKVEPGAIKSGEQRAVLDAAQKLRADLLKTHPEGRVGLVQDLINNKIALNDIINYEVQGGAKNLLKGVVADLDRAIIQHGSQNKEFGRLYLDAQKRFAQHAKTFRNKNIDQLIRLQDPAKTLAKMDSVQGIRDISKAIAKSPEGRETFNELKRFKLEQLIGDKLLDSTTQQIKFGTFSKLLEKGKNRELMKELLGPKEFKRLENLMKNSGRLAESANKFLNTSRTATTLIDNAALLAMSRDIMNLSHGNVWPLAKKGIGYLGVRQLSKLMTDPEFLKLAEKAIAAEKGNNKALLEATLQKMLPYTKVVGEQLAQNNQ
jgi:hypothetical protein